MERLTFDLAAQPLRELNTFLHTGAKEGKVGHVTVLNPDLSLIHI